MAYHFMPAIIHITYWGLPQVMPILSTALQPYWLYANDDVVMMKLAAACLVPPAIDDYQMR